MPKKKRFSQRKHKPGTPDAPLKVRLVPVGTEAEQEERMIEAIERLLKRAAERRAREKAKGEE